MKKLFLLNLLLLAGFYVYSQALPVGTPLLEEAARRLQVNGQAGLNSSFTIRPLYVGSEVPFDSLYYPVVDDAEKLSTSHSLRFAGEKGYLRLMPLRLTQQINTHHPYGWNDGAMIPAKGYQALASAGVYMRLGPLSLQLQPEFVFAGNGSFTGFGRNFDDTLWAQYYNVLNRIDAPERFGTKNYVRLFPGQSSIRLHLGKTSLGLSSENLWWGPGERNSLLMSNNAPGFPHITFNSTAPIKTKIGSFEWQVISGWLKGSGILPPGTARTFDSIPLYDPKPAENRYLNAFVATWQPKWTPGLYLGLSRAFYQYSSIVQKTLDGYFPVVGAFFKNNATDETNRGRDQLLSIFFRLVLPESKAEIYGEYGRNDHSANLRDLLVQPEHTRAYIIGAKKYYQRPKGKSLALFFELTQLQNTSTRLLRATPSWYAHHQVRHGYTHLGQVLGAGIGPGGSSQTVGINWLKGISKTGFFLERIVHNNDFYYEAFTPMQRFNSHWVDVSLNGEKTWQHKRMVYSARLSLVRSINYQWRYNEALHGEKYVNNIHAALSAAYRF